MWSALWYKETVDLNISSGFGVKFLIFIWSLVKRLSFYMHDIRFSMSKGSTYISFLNTMLLLLLSEECFTLRGLDSIHDSSLLDGSPGIHGIALRVFLCMFNVYSSCAIRFVWKEHITETILSLEGSVSWNLTEHNSLKSFLSSDVRCSNSFLNLRSR